jgi:hypothetical protein
MAAEDTINRYGVDQEDLGRRLLDFGLSMGLEIAIEQINKGPGEETWDDLYA